MQFITYSENEMTKVRIIEKTINKVITKEQACEALKCSMRTLYRYQTALKTNWPQWIIHWLKWKPSNNSPNRWKLDFLKEKIAQKRFRWFGPTLLSEKFEEIYWFEINHESLRLLMIKQWYRVPKKLNRLVKRQLRDRRSTYGMMIQFDGSYHDWLETWEIWCLLLAIDDATWSIVMMQFAHWESFEDIYHFRHNYMKQYWKPWSIYVDCHASYKVNAPRDQFDNDMKTRFQSWMWKLGIEVIYSKTPEWKWRVERSFKTHQDRLVKELRLQWIKTYEEANIFMARYYLPKHNGKFAVVAQEWWNYHNPLSIHEQEDYPRYFSKEEQRKVARNWIVLYHNQKLQLPRYTILNTGKVITTKETIDNQLRLYSWSKLLSYKKLI
jgi:hypothetical protein